MHLCVCACANERHRECESMRKRVRDKLSVRIFLCMETSCRVCMCVSVLGCVSVCAELQAERGQSLRPERHSAGGGEATAGTHHLPQIR